MPVVIVTDSTASLPAEVAAEHGIVVVPLQVVIGATAYDEGADGATPELVAAALRDWKPVSTSRPGPAVFAEVYERAARDGATEIVSIHLSGEMSGTFESAQLAARDAPVRVLPVDTRQVGVATGFAALAAAEVLAAG
ncbi:DegV family protein, partial [Nocardioides sp.]|uniref:DegV family protein n=1 Tax=Nocardioides sp. TaxID=35761 RepID=UPI002ED9FAF2